MFPSTTTADMQKMHEAEMVRNLEAARHRAAHAAARRGESRIRFARFLSRKPSLRTNSQPDIRPA
jgi:hypothetical protein